MRVHFHQQGIELNATDREHVDSRLRSALDRFASKVTKIAVHLADTNAEKGGVDKRCRLVVRIQGLKEVIIEDHDEDFVVLIDRIINRLDHTISRRLEKERFGKSRVSFDGASQATEVDPRE